MSNYKIKADAKELVNKFFVELEKRFGWAKIDDAKACAIIAVEQVEKFMQLDDKHNKDCHNANSHWPDHYIKLKQLL